MFSSICAAIKLNGNLSSTVNPNLLQSFSFSLPSHCRCGSLGTVCAESCERGTMTGWTKLTTNEITLWQCDTQGWGGGRLQGDPHFGLLGLWQADLRAAWDTVCPVGRVSTPGRPVYIEPVAPSQTNWHRRVLVRGLTSVMLHLFKSTSIIYFFYQDFFPFAAFWNNSFFLFQPLQTVSHDAL